MYGTCNAENSVRFWEGAQKYCCETWESFKSISMSRVRVPSAVKTKVAQLAEQPNTQSAQVPLAQYFLNILWKQVPLSTGEKLGSIPKSLSYNCCVDDGYFTFNETITPSSF